MTTDTVSLIAASLFLLIALVGGGFSAKELVIPEVPIWARIVSAFLGLVFASPFITQSFDHGTSRPDRPPSNEKSSERSNEGSNQDEITIHSANPKHAISPQHLRLISIRATAPRKPPRVGDGITIVYLIKNVREKPFRLASTFIGARDAAKHKKDSDGDNVGFDLRPTKTLRVEEVMTPTSPDKWRFWPCYAFKTNGGEAYCPNEWNAFSVTVLAP